MYKWEKKALGLLLIGLLMVSAVSNLFIFETHAADPAPVPQWANPRGDAGNTGLSSQDTSENYGNIAWSFSTAGDDISSPVIDADGNIYFISGGYLYALEPNGTQKWRYSVGSSVSSPAIGPYGAIYFVKQGSLYAISESGTELWHLEIATNPDYASSPLVSGDGRIFVGITVERTGYLYAIDPDGKCLWSFNESFNDSFYMHTPALAVGTDGLVYVAFAEYGNWDCCEENYEFIYVLKSDGTLKSMDKIVNYLDGIYSSYYAYIVSIVVSEDNTIYAVLEGDLLSVHAINNIGSNMWDFTMGMMPMSYPDTPSISLSPLGGVYFSVTFPDCETSAVYYLNKTGSVGWMYSIKSVDSLSACSVGGDGSIYFTSYHHYPDTCDWDYDYYNDYSYDILTLYSLNSDGSLRWQTELENQSTDWSYLVSDLSIANNGMLYLGSSSGTFYAIGGASTPPRNLRATGERGCVDLSWQPPEHNGTSPLVSYNIYRCEVYDYYDSDYYYGGDDWYHYSTPLLIDTVPASNHTYRDTSVVNGETYSYYVTAVNKYESGRSNSVLATPEGKPSQPLNLKVVAGDSNISLSWEEPADNGGHPITGYNVYRGVFNGGEQVIATLVEDYYYDWYYGEYYSSEPETNYTDTSVHNGQAYYYYVTAVTRLGEGDASSIVTAIPTTVPSPPLSLKVTSGDGYVNLTWDSPRTDGGACITGYKIYAGTVPGEEIPIATVGTYARFYQDKDVSNGGTYYYYVTALNSVGESDRSNKVSGNPEEGLGASCSDESGSSAISLLVPSLLGAIVILVGSILIYMVARNRKKPKTDTKSKLKPVKIKKKKLKNPPVGR